MHTSHPDLNGSVAAHTRLILDSYRSLFGSDLLDVMRNAAAESGCSGDLSERLWEAAWPVISTDASADPLLNYANRAALDLWEMTWEQMFGTPGRHTAEPAEREERERFLSEVRRRGCISDYSGIRVTRTGRRFRIRSARVWNLTGAGGEYRGQAATFAKPEWL